MRKQLYTDYEITENGDVYSLKTYHKKRGTKKLRPQMSRGGYLYVAISVNGQQTMRKIHHLVAEAYLPERPSDSHQIRHLDGNPQNNHYTNLAWGTAKENREDMERHGRVPRCEKNGRALLTQSQVDKIRSFSGRMCRGGWSNLSREFGVSPSTICAVLHNRNWTKRLPL